MSDVVTEQAVESDEQVTQNRTAAEIKPRRPWLAALLSLVGSPVGQVYAGRLRRAVLWWGASLAYLVLLSLAFISLPVEGEAAAMLVLGGSLAFPILMAIDAYWVAKRQPAAPLKAYQRLPAYGLLFIAFMVGHNAGMVVTRTYIAEAFMVPNWPMHPTVDPGDRLLVDKLWYGPEKMERNDLVVYHSVEPDSPPLLMRVVGLPGDTIEIVEEEVFLNGEAWDDTHRFIDQAAPLAPELANFGPLQVPDDAFFVLGDNRRRVKDSRITGPIPLANLIGQAKFIYWSNAVPYAPAEEFDYQFGPRRGDRIGKRLD